MLIVNHHSVSISFHCSTLDVGRLMFEDDSSMMDSDSPLPAQTLSGDAHSLDGDPPIDTI